MNFSIKCLKLSKRNRLIVTFKLKLLTEIRLKSLELKKKLIKRDKLLRN